MAPLTVLARARPPSATLFAYSRCLIAPRTSVFFSTSAARFASPQGTTSATGFRIARPKRWDENGSALDNAGKFFLMTEIFRGMWVVLEQFFRPPYVHTRESSFGDEVQATDRMPTDIRSSTLLRRDQSHLVSEASMHYGATPLARSGVLLVSCVKLSARLKPSRSKPKSGRMGAEGRLDMTLT